MMLDWNDYQKQIGAQLAHFMKLTPDSVRGYHTLPNANAANSHLGEKTRQLISLAVAVTTRCDGCITVHTEAALKAGAAREEISEALGVAMAMNAGAALIFSLRAMDAVDAHSTPKQTVLSNLDLSRHDARERRHLAGSWVVSCYRNIHHAFTRCRPGTRVAAGPPEFRFSIFEFRFPPALSAEPSGFSSCPGR